MRTVVPIGGKVTPALLLGWASADFSAAETDCVALAFAVDVGDDAAAEAEDDPVLAAEEAVLWVAVPDAAPVVVDFAVFKIQRTGDLGFRNRTGDRRIDIELPGGMLAARFQEGVHQPHIGLAVDFHIHLAIGGKGRLADQRCRQSQKCDHEARTFPRAESVSLPVLRPGLRMSHQCDPFLRWREAIRTS